jgi:transglutaminase-like putative cysteine protease
MTPENDRHRRFCATIGFSTVTTARFLFAVAPATTAGRVLSETFSAIGPSGSIPVEEIAAPHGGRLHELTCDPGVLEIAYSVEIEATEPPVREVEDRFEVFLYGRPSRYCPTDHLGGFAVAEFGNTGPVIDRTRGIVEWIRKRVVYLPGASTVHDSAEDTLLTGTGTCRDFAHLGVALCRAVDIPARFVSVYAPGLAPMDFHAAFEIFDAGRWWLFDATSRAPRGAMARIATGRDAADTAFATVLEGTANLDALEVLATVDGSLPTESLDAVIELS